MNKSLLPSAGWKSWQAYEGLNFPSMNERLQDFMVSMNKSALIKHAEITTGRTLSLSKPFSAGFNWCCFELIANDGTFFIARVKLPRHPDDDDTVDEDSVSYMRKCEIATMNFLQERVEAVSVPQIYGWAMPGSQNAQEVGAACMLIEGFQGNVLFDGHSKVYDLPVGGIFNVSSEHHNLTGVDIRAGAYFSAVDLFSSRTSDHYFHTDWIHLKFLKGHWSHYR